MFQMSGYEALPPSRSPSPRGARRTGSQQAAERLRKLARADAQKYREQEETSFVETPRGAAPSSPDSPQQSDEESTSDGAESVADLPDRAGTSSVAQRLRSPSTSGAAAVPSAEGEPAGGRNFSMLGAVYDMEMRRQSFSIGTGSSGSTLKPVNMAKGFAKLLKIKTGQSKQSDATEFEVDTDERNQAAVVDWKSKKVSEIAMTHQLYQRPVYVTEQFQADLQRNRARGQIGLMAQEASRDDFGTVLKLAEELQESVTAMIDHDGRIDTTQAANRASGEQFHGGLLTQQADEDRAAKRKAKALVIGIAAYESPLYFPVMDAKVVAEKFRHMGFEVMLLTDDTQAPMHVDIFGMERAIRDFVDSIEEGDVAAFVFFGRVVHYEDENFLLPQEEVTGPRYCRTRAVSLEQTMKQIDDFKPLATLCILNIRTESDLRIDGLESSSQLYLINTFRQERKKEESDQENSRFVQVLVKHLETRRSSVADMFETVAKGIEALDNANKCCVVGGVEESKQVSLDVRSAPLRSAPLLGKLAARALQDKNTAGGVGLSEVPQEEQVVSKLQGAFRRKREQVGKHRTTMWERFKHCTIGSDFEGKKIPFDRADAQTDKHGWMQDHSTKGDTPALYPLWSTTDADIGSLGGSGTRIYLSIIKFLSFAFFVMACLTTPSLTANLAGKMYDHPGAARFRNDIARSTLGNAYANHTDIYSGKVATLFVASEMDALSTIFMLIALVWLEHKMEDLKEKTDRENVSMADYTVQITPTNIKKDGSKAFDEFKCRINCGICSFFLGGNYAPDTHWSERASEKRVEDANGIGGSGKTDFHRELQDYFKSQGLRISSIGSHPDGTPKPTIWTCWDEDENVVLWERKTELLIRLEAAMAQIPNREAMRDNQQQEEKPLPPRKEEQTEEILKHLHPVLKELAKLNTQLFNLNHGTDLHKWKPVVAYVTFQDDKDKDRALKLSDRQPEAHPTGSRPTGLPDVIGRVQEDLKAGTGKSAHEPQILIGDRFCDVVEAPEPETLQWEHLEYSLRSRRIRSCIIIGATVFFLAIAFMILTAMRVLQDSQAYLDQCKYVLGPDMEAHAQMVCPGATGNYSNYSAVYRKTYNDVKDLTGAAFPRIVDLSDENSQQLGAICDDVVGVAEWPDWVVTGDTQSCHRLDSHPTYVYDGGDLDAICYGCICSLDTMADEVKAHLPPGYCDDYTQDTQRADTYGTIATVLVVAINQGLKKGIQDTAQYLKSHTLEEEMASKSIRVFICQLTNTAILVLVLKTNVGFVARIPGRHFNSPTAEWYAKIATPMVPTMIIQYAVPCIFHLINYIWRHWIWSPIMQWRATTQNQLNQAVEPDEYGLAAAYGEILLAMSVTLIFGSGVPLLYWIAAVGFGVRYWVDRCVILRVCKKPPLYSHTLINSFDEVAQTMLVVHAGFGVYLLGTAGGTDPADETKFDPFVPHVIPMLCAFIVVFVARLLKFLASVGWVSLELTKIFASEEHAAKRAKETLKPFNQAYAAGEIANEDDDYENDIFEKLDALRVAFLKKIDKEKNAGHMPFTKEDAGKTPGGVDREFTSDPHAWGPEVYAPINPVSAKVYYTNGDNPKGGANAKQSEDEVYKALVRAIKVPRRESQLDEKLLKQPRPCCAPCRCSSCCCRGDGTDGDGFNGDAATTRSDSAAEIEQPQQDDDVVPDLVSMPPGRPVARRSRRSSVVYSRAPDDVEGGARR